MTDTLPPDWKPQNMKDLLNKLAPTLATVRAYVRSANLADAQDSLNSVVSGNYRAAADFYERSQRLIVDRPGKTPRQIIDDIPNALYGWEPAYWAVRLCYARKNIYPEWTEEERAHLAHELATDPLILKSDVWKFLEPFKVLGFSAEEITALNAATVADRQARVTEIESLL